MKPEEARLEYPFGDELPPPGQAMDVANDIWWIRMPLPFALDHINLWCLRDSIDGQEGWTLIDCGVARDEVRQSWEALFTNMLQGLPVLRVIVTHMHPDHVGLADWLCKRWNAPLYMTMTDYMTARHWSSVTVSNDYGGTGGKATADFFARHGLQDADALEQMRNRADYYPDLVPSVPAEFHRLMHGDELTIGDASWRIIVGYGHAPEHASLYCKEKEVLISGDMLLPRISTNVSVHSFEPMGNPLPAYLESLHGYDDVPDQALVLPSHGRPFRGAQIRIAQQHAHHDERFAEVLQACETPKTAAELLPVLFRRKLDTHQLSFAMGEALAHLHALYYRGELKRQVDKNGVIRFVTA
ncbi:MAG TPA: MBL fold metallo-hydrolase [Burkholderiaceae bacterium]|nr:MBL fold metallo-hydrolase [Burkholderiaceae bacterium]